MSSVGAAQSAAVPVSNACAPLRTDLGGRSESQARASRRNGAKSRGPKTSEGKTRASRNALKHGLRAGKHVLLPDEDSDEFEALELALFEELAPEGALQGLLAGRIARAAWRLARAERIEVEMFAERHYPGAGPGLAIIRDGNSTRSFETLLRYRGAALAEFTRCLRTLQGLQAKPAPGSGKRAAVAESAALRTFDRRRERSGERAPDRGASKVQPQANPSEPETRADRGESEPARTAPKSEPTPAVRSLGKQLGVRPDEPKPSEPEPLLQSRFGRVLTGQPMPAPAPGALGTAPRGWDRGSPDRGAAPSR
jgi:hypothetical protein